MSADRLSTLLHDLDDVAVSPPPAAAVRARGTQLRRRRQGAAGAGLLALAAAGVVGLGGLSGTQDASLQPAPFATAPGVPQPAEPGLPDEGDPTVVDGSDLGFVAELSEQDGGVVLELDRADLLTHEELVARNVEQGIDPAEALDFELVDELDEVHRYPVSPDAAVTLTVGLAPPDLQGGSVDSSLEELRGLLADPATRQSHLFEVEVQDGVVVRIDHTYIS